MNTIFTRFSLIKICFAAYLVCAGAVSFSKAQSTDQSAPTPVTTNAISGTIPARDIGDARLTNYFYTFNGSQGDVFINVVTQNLDGDIDVFTADGLRPLTKITVFSDNSDSETGRIVYLRKFENLLLRIQGRSPNDEPAAFQIKFAGSFQALQPVENPENPRLPEVSANNQGEVRVNSVGTIISPTPKPAPEQVETAEREIENTPPETVKTEKEITVKSVDDPMTGDVSAKIEIKKADISDQPAENTVAETPEIEENKPEKTDAPAVDAGEIAEKTELPAAVEKENTEIDKNVDAENKTSAAETVETPLARVVRPLKAEQLAGIELVVSFKNGKTLKYPLNGVFSFNVNQGILTIILYDGTVSKYSFLDIEKISMEKPEN